MVSRVRVLYLAGSGRSGSTLVTTILGQLPGFVAAGEVRYLWRRGLVENRPCGCGRPLRSCPVWTAVLRDVPGSDPAGVAARLGGRLRIRRLPVLLRRHRRGQPSVPGHPDDARLARLYPAIARHVGAVPAPAEPSGPSAAGESEPARVPNPPPAGRVVVDSSKLPPYGALLGDLPGVDLYVLHLVRDPRATAFSWRRRRRLDGDLDDRLMSRPPVWKAALLWLVWNATTLRLWAGTGRYLRVRYEDFVADPAGTVARIAGFVGVDPGELPFPTPDTVRLAPTHSVAGNPARHRTGVVSVVADNEWVTALPRWAYAVVTALTWPLLRRFGYPIRRPAPPFTARPTRATTAGTSPAGGGSETGPRDHPATPLGGHRTSPDAHGQGG
ncbi:sulfotransferase [Micromonospora sp. HM5-17]|uniref:sulfotransferase n=1 Tax=Micromonospora sp. HM5-17 TaxID=2487710 RepID=UPI0013157379|nr:sulfotransferase [Micromonospora sp. HM5-17]